MIVTCPGCASKYRVRNEAVPAEGARMRCPKCETLFLAKPPANGPSDDDGPSGLAPPTPSLVPGGAPGFGASPQTGSTPSFGGPAPFGAAPSPLGPPSGAPSPFGAPAPFGAAPSPFGAPAPSPFGAAAPSPFGAPAPAPFGAPAPSPFGSPPGPSPFGSSPGPSPFGSAPPAPSPPQFGAAPAAPNTAGPLTAMMQSFNPNAPPPAVPPPPRDDDPFAKISLDSLQDPGMNVPTSERLAPQRPATTAPPAPRPATTTPPAPTTTQAPPPVLARPPGSPSLAAEIASWLVVLAGVAGAISGAVFAGWTSEAIDLDASLMATFEENFGVRPPASFTGKDAPPLDALRIEAKAKEDAGDLAAAAVLWRRIIARDDADATAKAALPRVMTALGERLKS